MTCWQKPPEGSDPKFPLLALSLLTKCGSISGSVFTIFICSPNVSRLMRGSSGSYSVERLMEFLTALGHNVEVKITPARKKHGAMSVVVAA